MSSSKSLAPRASGSFASSARCRRNDRRVFLRQLLATASNHGRTDGPWRRTSARRRHDSRKTMLVKSSAVAQDAVRRKQWLKTASECRLKSSPNAAPSLSLVRRQRSSSDAPSRSVPTLDYVRHNQRSSQYRLVEDQMTPGDWSRLWDRTSVEHPLPPVTVRDRPRTDADQAKSFATVRHRPGRAYLQAGGRGFESHRLHHVMSQDMGKS